jgi:hypothetical protein
MNKLLFFLFFSSLFSLDNYSQVIDITKLSKIKSIIKQEEQIFSCFNNYILAKGTLPTSLTSNIKNHCNLNDSLFKNLYLDDFSIFNDNDKFYFCNVIDLSESSFIKNNYFSSKYRKYDILPIPSWGDCISLDFLSSSRNLLTKIKNIKESNFKVSDVKPSNSFNIWFKPDGRGDLYTFTKNNTGNWIKQSNKINNKSILFFTSISDMLLSNPKENDIAIVHNDSFAKKYIFSPNSSFKFKWKPFSESGLNSNLFSTINLTDNYYFKTYSLPSSSSCSSKSIKLKKCVSNSGLKEPLISLTRSKQNTLPLDIFSNILCDRDSQDYFDGNCALSPIDNKCYFIVSSFDYLAKPDLLSIKIRNKGLCDFNGNPYFKKNWPNNFKILKNNILLKFNSLEKTWYNDSVKYNPCPFSYFPDFSNHICIDKAYSYRFKNEGSYLSSKHYEQSDKIIQFKDLTW